MRSAAALVVAAALLACWPALDGSFVYDDAYYVFGNPAVVGGASPPASVWTSPLGDPSQALWRPLTVLTWRWQWPDGAAAADARPFRALNLALHVAVSLLVLALGHALGFARSVAAIAALLFAVHPVHAEAVAWVTGRAELLAAAFVLAGWIAYRARGRGAALACGLAVLAGGLCKEHALLAPALYVGFDVLCGERPRRAGALAAGAAVVALVALRAAILPAGLPGDAPYGELSLGARAVVGANVLARALALLVWPHPLRIFYQREELTGPSTATLAILAAAALLAAWAWRRERRAAAALLLLPVSLGTVLQLVPIGETFAERFLYLPSVLGCLALAALLGARLRAEAARGRGLDAGVAAAGIALLLAVPTTRAACATFRDDLALWAHAARVTPHLAHARYNHGYFLRAHGRRLAVDVDQPGAADELRASLELAPAHRYAAFAHDMLGQHALEELPPSPALAAHHFRSAIERLPSLLAPRVHLASLALADAQVVPREEARAALAPILADRALAPDDRQLVESLAAELASGGG